MNAASEEDEPEAIRSSEARFFDLAMKDNQLWSQESIFSDELGFTSGQVGGYRERNRMTIELGEMEEKSFER